MSFQPVTLFCYYNIILIYNIIIAIADIRGTWLKSYKCYQYQIFDYFINITKTYMIELQLVCVIGYLTVTK